MAIKVNDESIKQKGLSDDPTRADAKSAGAGLTAKKMAHFISQVKPCLRPLAGVISVVCGAIMLSNILSMSGYLSTAVFHPNLSAIAKATIILAYFCLAFAAYYFGGRNGLCWFVVIVLSAGFLFVIVDSKLTAARNSVKAEVKAMPNSVATKSVVRAKETKIVSFEAGETKDTGIIIKKGDYIHYSNLIGEVKLMNTDRDGFHLIQHESTFLVTNDGPLEVVGGDKSGSVTITLIPQS